MSLRSPAIALLATLGLAACGSDVTSPTALGPIDASRNHSASGSRIVVTESDITRQAENTPPLDNWVLYVRALGTGAFRTGPANPPLGVGSLTLTTPTAADKVTLFNYDHVGVELDQVRSMSYHTYRESGTAQQVAAINIQVDVNGTAPGGFTTLVFEPVYNTAQGAVVSNTWQDWDAYLGGNAIWWSSNPIPGAPNRDTFVTWNSIVAANPDAVIVGGYGVNQGSGNAGLITSVDALHFDTPTVDVTYDFEPYRTATTTDMCKDGGWSTVRRADGSTFKNQGDCVSYVANGK